VANGATLALNVGGTNQFTAANVNTLLTNLGGANGSSTTGFAAGSTLALDTTGAATSVTGNIVNSTGTGGGAVGVTKWGANLLTLSGANTNTGTTSILQGSLTLAPTAGGMNLGAVTATTSGAGFTAGNIVLTLGGAGTNSITSITETSGAAQQLSITKNTTATWSVGNVDLKQGNSSSVSSGILNLNGTLTFGLAAGTLRQFSVSGGTLNYNNAAAVRTIGTTTAAVTTGTWLTFSGGALDNGGASHITSSDHNPNMMLNANLTFTGTNSLNFGTGLVSLGSAAGTSRTITVTANTLTLGGIISNGTTATALTKAGDGTLELRGINTYNGTTAVNAGTLNVSAGNINSSTAINVAAGGTLRYNSSTALTVAPSLAGAGTSSRAVLGGTGTVNATITLDNVGDVLSPGNSPGIQAYTPAQTWSSFSYDWEVNNFTGATAGTDFDQITGSSFALTGVSGSYILNVLGLTAGNVAGLTPNFSEINRNWTIMTSSGSSTFDAADWTINTAGFSSPDTGTWALAQSGNDLVLSYTVIPEPSAALLGGLGMVLLLRRRRA
jgi:autotransporter-associated beta strand protein